MQDVVKPGQSILGREFLALHLGQGQVVDRKHAEFGIEHLLVELLVALVELLELGVALDQGVDFRLGLPFEHGILLQHICQRPGRMTRRVGHGASVWSVR